MCVRVREKNLNNTLVVVRRKWGKNHTKESNLRLIINIKHRKKHVREQLVNGQNLKMAPFFSDIDNWQLK